MVCLTTGFEKSDGKLHFWQVVIGIVAMDFFASSKVNAFTRVILVRMVFHMDAMTCMHEMIDAILQLLR